MKEPRYPIRRYDEDGYDYEERVKDYYEALDRYERDIDY